MEHGPKTTPAEEKISKSLPQLLQEVAQGEYTDFRSWLKQNKAPLLDLSGQLDAEKIEPNFMSHLAQALHGTEIISVNLSRNSLGEGYEEKGSEAKKVEKKSRKRKEAGLEAFIRGLEGTQVRELNLASSFMGFNQTLKCVQALEKTNITALILSDIRAFQGNIPDIQLLAKVLRGSQLQLLDLSFNNMLGSQGAQILIEGLKNLPKLNTLNLASTGINPEAAINIVQALKGSAVTSLDMSMNSLGPCVAELINQLKDTQVVTLYLCQVGINPEIAEDLARALKNSSLKKVDFSMNPMKDEGIEHIAKVLQETQLMAINLAACRVENNERIANIFAECIPGSNLLGVNLGLENSALIKAIKLNQRKFLFTPYEIARNMELFSAQEKNEEIRALNPTPTPSQEDLLKAHYILSGLPLEIQQHALSFLPAMNAKKIQRYYEIAQKAAEKAHSGKEKKTKPGNNG